MTSYRKRKGAISCTAFSLGNGARVLTTFLTSGLLIAIASLLALPAAAQNASSLSTSVATVTTTETAILPGSNRVDFGQEVASAALQELAEWVITSADNHNLPYIIFDKVQAQIFVFNAQGKLHGAAPALLGLAIGDDSIPGIGQRKLSSIRPEERTTPAGRFVASLDRDIHGKELLWIDYDTAFSLHPVVTSQPKERRAQRLATPTPLDNRITYGCINVPVKFYENIVRTVFNKTNGIVYVLPETRSARQLFGYNVRGPIAPLQTAAQVTPAPSAAP